MEFARLHIGEMMVFAIALAVSIVATPLVRILALRWRLGDKPNGRKAHDQMIPHLGGIAMFFSVGSALSLSIPGLLPGFAGQSLLVKAVPALFLIVGLGIVDDTRNLRARHKLFVQVLAAAMLISVGFALFTGVAFLDISSVLVAVLSLVFIVGMLSSVNLIDGHDGLAGGVALLSAVAFAIIGNMLGVGEVVAMSLAICGACLGFLVFNFPPGRIYMGDTGSMMLGLILALSACMLTMRAPSLHTFAAVCFALGVPLMDTMLAIARRVALRSPLFAADTLHMHHVLRASGLSPRRTLLVLYAMQAFFSLLGIAAAAGWLVPVFVGLGFVTVVFTSFLFAMVENHMMQPVRRIITHAVPFDTSLARPLAQQRKTATR